MPVDAVLIIEISHEIKKIRKKQMVNIYAFDLSKKGIPIILLLSILYALINKVLHQSLVPPRRFHTQNKRAIIWKFRQRLLYTYAQTSNMELYSDVEIFIPFV